MNLRCAIIDDEPLALGLLESYVKKTPVLTTNALRNLLKCRTSHEVIARTSSRPLVSGYPDARTKRAGILAHGVREHPYCLYHSFQPICHRRISGQCPRLPVEMLKPISYADFMEAVNKAVHWFELQQKAESHTFLQSEGNAEKYIYVKSDYKLIQIELDKILYIEGLKDYIKIHLEGMEKPILSLISMRAMEEKLPANRFIRVHRSFIVQKQKIKIIDKGRIVFGKDYIPVSDSYKQELQNYVNEHIV